MRGRQGAGSYRFEPVANVLRVEVVEQVPQHLDGAVGRVPVDDAAQDAPDLVLAHLHPVDGHRVVAWSEALVPAVQHCGRRSNEP
jgi:hypothetical protein